MKYQQIVPGGDGAHYVSYEKRTGNNPSYILQEICHRRDYRKYING